MTRTMAPTRPSTTETCQINRQPGQTQTQTPEDRVQLQYCYGAVDESAHARSGEGPVHPLGVLANGYEEKSTLERARRQHQKPTDRALGDWPL